jgi:RNA polymerase sigma factor (sigma-70 family)
MVVATVSVGGGASALPEDTDRATPPARDDDSVALAATVRRAAVGNQDAWNEIVDRFAGMVWAIARSHRLDDATAADVSQATWLRLVEHLDSVQQPERLGAWLATTARRESLRVIRMAGRQVPTGDDFTLLEAPRSDAVDAPIHRKGQDEVLRAVVAQLPCRDQRLLGLLFADVPLSYKEIAEELEVPIGSIGPTRARCLERVRRIAKRVGLVWDGTLL